MRGFGGPVLFRCNRPLQISSCSAHQRLAEISCQQQWEATAESPNSAVKKKKKKSHPALSVAAPPSPDYSPERDHMETFSDMHTCTLRGRKRILFAAVKTVIKNELCQTGTRPPRGQLRFLIFWGKAKQIHSHSAVDTYRSNAYVQFSH